MRHIPLILSLMTLLTGCTVKSLGDNADSQVILTDAKQRAITVIAVDTASDRANRHSKSIGQEEQKDVTHDGRRVIPHRIVCAEPSPDIATAVSESLKASLKGKADVMGKGTAELEGNFDRSVTESIAQLGSRLATIQLLRDELSDLCRAYANGAVSSITYTLRLSRLDKKMITLLVSEASAGALSRALIAINGAASNGGSVSAEKLIVAEAKIKEAAKAVGSAGAVLDTASKKHQAADESAKESTKKELTKAEEELRFKLNELTGRLTEKLILETRGTGLVAGSTALAVAGLPTQTVSSLDLKGIHKTYLDDDDLGTLLDACLTSLEDNGISTRESPELEKLRAEIDKVEMEMTTADSEVAHFDRRAGGPLPPPGPNQLAHNVPEAERKAMLEAMRKAEFYRIRHQQLLRRYDEKTGASDKTGLLNFCRRDGMYTITRLIEKKIVDRTNLESTRQYIELCKAVANSAGVTAAAKSSCVNALLRTSNFDEHAYPPVAPYPTAPPIDESTVTEPDGNSGK